MTPRTPGRRTFGPVIAEIAAQLGKPRTPLQRYIDDVSHEVLDDGSWAYRSVVILGPRRMGKTSIMEPVLTHRGEQRRCEMIMTMGTQVEAVELFEEIAADLEESPVPERFRAANSQGRSTLHFTATGSRLRAVSPNARIGHSKSLRLVWVDEFWEHTFERLTAMRNGFRPTFLTTGGQEWLTSTAGVENSTAFIRERRRGRADVVAGRNSERAFFDVSAPEITPEGVPLADLPERELLDLLADNHPAVGYLFSREELIRLMLMDVDDLGGRGGLLRAYGNLTDAGERPAAFTPEQMTGNQGARIPDDARVALGVAFDEDGRDAAISVAWRDDVGRAHTSYRQGDGRLWVSGVVRYLVEHSDVSVVAGRSTGAARDLLDGLERSGLPVLRLSQPDLAAAGSRFHDQFSAGMILWPVSDDDGSNAFSEAVGAAEPFSGKWLSATGDPVTTLQAGTVAVWAADHAPEPVPSIEPEIW